jgi:hypothetical protein
VATGPTIIAKFLADTSKMTDEVDKATSGAGSKIGNFAKNAALAVGGAFAVGSIIEFGKASVEAAAADAEAADKLAQTLKNVTGATNDQVAATEDFIGNLSKTAAIADDDLRPAMDKLVRGFGNAEDAQKALSLATDVSAGTGKDLATVSDALMKAANGSTGALSKMGVEVKNADGSAKSLDQIMSEMSSTFSGQAAVAAESTAGQMRNAQIQFGEFQEQIGTALLPVLATLAGFMVNTLIPAISGIATWVTENKDAVIAGLVGMAVVMAGVIWTMVVPAFTAWAAASGTAALATLAALAPFLLIGAAIAAVAYLIIKNWDDIKAGAEVVWNFVTNAVRATFDWISANWPLILAIITGPIGIAVLLIQRNWDTIKEGATAVWQWIVAKWDAIRDAIGASVAAIGGYITTMVDFLRKPIAAATEVYNWVSERFRALVDFLAGIVGSIGATMGRVADAIKAPVNAVLRVWNNLEFRIPTVHIPEFDIPGIGKVGGGQLGGQSFPFPDIPLLAGGGVLTAPTLFVGGEAGTEIVAPEAMLRSIVAEESRGGNFTLNLYPRTANASDVAYGFRRLEILAGLA